ncbi:MAG TPA: adenylate cyclase regulatory domain-containing protein [Acidimicrobiia bacterium]|nr:adenylate cyclase regulatory domain-containing protein [Acidimicrobiia bacterium]
MSSLDDLRTAGLYDPAAPDAAERGALLQYLLDQGMSVPEIRRADEEDQLISAAALRQLRPGGPRTTMSEAARAADVDAELAQKVWRAVGFPEPRPNAREITVRDVEMLRTVGSLAAFVGESEALLLARKIGEAVTQIAEAEVALLRTEVEAPLAAQSEWAAAARSYADITGALFPAIADMIDTLHRHHIVAVAGRYAFGSTPSATNTVELVVGFADLTGYTELAGRLGDRQLGRLLDVFEAVTGDLITAAGAQVVKRIGDEVMFVTRAPGVACALGLDLVDAVAARGLPPLCVGIAIGPVIVRQGDFHGPTVNLAARLVSAAGPGEVVTDGALRDRLARVERFGFRPLGSLELAGFDDGVESFRLSRRP